MKLHILKIEEEYFEEVACGDKTFELRKNDRDYQVGDVIHFVDTDGNEIYWKINNIFQITYVLESVPEYGLREDYCILGIKELVTK